MDSAGENLRSGSVYSYQDRPWYRRILAPTDYTALLAGRSHAAQYSSDMEQPSFDPGLTQKFSGRLRRFINKDGSFNVRRLGATWRATHPYLHLINMSWPTF